MDDELNYPRPRVSDYDLHRVLYDLQENEDLFLEFSEDPDRILATYPLDEDARALLRAKDYDGMVRRGIHPVAVVAFKRHFDWGMKMTSDATETSARE